MDQCRGNVSRARKGESKGGTNRFWPIPSRHLVVHLPVSRGCLWLRLISVCVWNSFIVQCTHQRSLKLNCSAVCFSFVMSCRLNVGNNSSVLSPFRLVPLQPCTSGISLTQGTQSLVYGNLSRAGSRAETSSHPSVTRSQPAVNVTWSCSQLTIWKSFFPWFS